MVLKISFKLHSPNAVLKNNLKIVVGKYGFNFTLKPQLVNMVLKLIFKTAIVEYGFKKQKVYFCEYFEKKSICVIFVKRTHDTTLKIISNFLTIKA